MNINDLHNILGHYPNRNQVFFHSFLLHGEVYKLTDKQAEVWSDPTKSCKNVALQIEFVQVEFKLQFSTTFSFCRV